jgi:hypothetical protein
VGKRRPSKPIPAPSAAYQVFVSHATADKWVARMICEKIDAIAGAKTFRDDRDIQGGDDIPEALREEIQRSSELVVVLTPVSVGRPWVMLEIGAAWLAGKRIVPVCYHVEPTTIPTILQKTKAILLNDFDRYLAELAARIGDERR